MLRDLPNNLLFPEFLGKGGLTPLPNPKACGSVLVYGVEMKALLAG